MNKQTGVSDNISVDFLIDDGAVPIPVLNSVLSSLQQAIYAVGAYDIGKEQLRGATRYRYTLCIGAVHHSSLHIDLIPAVQQFIEQMGLFTAIVESVAASALYDAIKFAFRRWQDHYHGKPPENIVDPAEPEQSPEVIRDQALWQSACNSARAIAKSGIPVRLAMKTLDGTNIEVMADLNGAARILRQDAIMRGRAQKYSDCELIGVDINGPYLRARIPFYQDAVIRCAFESLNPALVANSLYFGSEIYTIVGTPVWNPGRYHQDKPSKIEIITVEDSEGDIILTSIRDDDSEQENSADGGLFSTGEEDAS